MNTVSGLNKLSLKQYEKEAICLKDIPIDDINPIIKCNRVNTKFGERIMLELEKNVVFLPQKYLRMTGDQIEDLCKGNFYFKKIKQGITNYTLQFGMYEI